LSEKKYKNPNITISKVFTKKGDSGKTELIGKKNISKHDIRVKAYGQLDHLNAVVGGCVAEIEKLKIENKEVLELLDILESLQHKIFNLGNMLATVDTSLLEHMPQINDDDLNNLENNIEKYNAQLPSLSSFVLPGGSMINIWFNLSRTETRKCERIIVEMHSAYPVKEIVLKYINRLSDAFFVWGRWINFNMNINEKTWDSNKG